MSRFKILKISVIIIICSFILITSVGANSLSSVKINQCKQNGEILKVYFEAKDENERRILNLTENNVVVSVENKKLEITEIIPFSKSNEKIAYIFLLDISGSVGRTKFDGICEAISAWIDKMDGGNQIAVVTFGDKVTVVSDFTNDKTKLKQLVSDLKNTDGNTQLYGGIIKAADMLKISDLQLPDRRTVVVFTDGINGHASSYTKDEAVKAITEANIPFYAAGFTPLSKTANDSLADFGSIMRQSGGELYYIKDEKSISTTFDDIYYQISDIYLATTKIPDELADGGAKKIALSVSIEGRTIEKGVDLKFVSFEPVENSVDVIENTSEELEEVFENESIPTQNYEEQSTKPMIYIAIFTIPALGIIVVVVFLLVKRHKKIKEKKEAEQKENEKNTPAPVNKKQKTVGMEDINKPPKVKGKTVPLFSELPFTLDITVRSQNYEPRYIKNITKEITTIGRNSDNDIVIDDVTVSGLQCFIKITLDGAYITHKSNTNPTYVDDKTITDESEKMPYYSVVKMGRTELTVDIKRKT